MFILFFIILAILFYIYFLYPIVLSVKRFDVDTLESPLESPVPFVSIIIPAYNEEKHIEEKLRNTLTQEYPEDQIEIIVTSDGSTDQTVSIAHSFRNKRIKVIENKTRGGKNSALNIALEDASGEIIIFTDANALFVKNALKKLVGHFRDQRVGLVCGHLKYIKGSISHVGKGEGLYFRYESWIKRLESRWGAVSVVTGAIYAIRKEFALPLEPDIANDFAHPVQVGAKGYKVLFEPKAIAYEQSTESILEEFRRRARIVTRGFTAFARYWKRYRMLSGIRGFCFISHKLIRWFTPFFLVGLFITNIFLKGIFFNITLALQIAFYMAAIIGIITRRGWGKAFAIPFYFCMINFAALVGFVNFLRGRRQAVWEVAKTTR
jgi:cellulose synthase/poly-beta-1,6-N-acetylglucosamine synthase-like glycosyltransferase